MTKHPLKNWLQYVGVTALIVVGVSAHAVAFTETKIPQPVGQASEEAPAANLNIEENSGVPGLTLTTPDRDTSETELDIPGVGKIGTLPKFDFGLELLYGNSTQDNQTLEFESQQDDVMIKGKIRHRF